MNEIIHQTWKNQNPPTNMFRKSWIRSWERMNPGWSYRLWDDMEMAAFVREEFPRFFPIWCRYPQAIMRVDAWRYLLLKKVGGLYVDLDFACLRPLDEWLPTEDRFGLADQGNGELCNAFMWAPSPNLPFFDNIETELKLHANAGHVLSATGPGFLTKYAKSREHLIERLPTPQVYPLPFWAHDECKILGDLTMEEVAAKLPQAGAVTFWSHSWACQEDTKPIIPPRERREGVDISGHKKVLIVCLTRGDRNDVDTKWMDDVVSGFEMRWVDILGFVEDSPNGPEIAAERIEALIQDLAMEVHHDWFFICTDRTYVVLDRIRDLIDPDWDGICSGHIETDGRIDLNAGVLLSKYAIAQLHKIPKTGSRAEFKDVLGQLFADCGILWKPIPQLQGDNYQIPSSRNDLVTAYTNKVSDLDLIHTIFKSEPDEIIPTVHSHWRDELVFFEGDLFARSGGGGYGSWKVFKDDKKLLLWNSGAEEVFMPLSPDQPGGVDKGIVLSLENARYLFQDK